MITTVIILLLASCQHVEAFGLQMPGRLSRNKGPLQRLANTYDFDMVRPAVEFDLADIVNVEAFLKDYDAGAKIQGVYAVQDVVGTVLYVGSSMAMSADIGRLSLKLGYDIVNTLRIQTFPNPNPDAIEAYKLELIRQLSPSGNLVNYEMWEDTAVIRDSENAVAIADSAEASVDKRSAQERLADAVGNDGTKASSVESPFAEEAVDLDSYVIGPNTSAGIEFTKENVDKVLDEVRPYLIADGGNVEVVSVDEFTRSVSLALQGACGSCPSSTTTMKMGIERVLKENFPNLGPVLQVNPAAEAAGLTKDAVEKALEKVLPAIKAMGGTVEVGNVNSATGVVVLLYKGPPRLKVGIKLVMKDLALVTSVSIEDLPDAHQR